LSQGNDAIKQLMGEGFNTGHGALWGFQVAGWEDSI